MSSAISLHNPFSIERQQVMPAERLYRLSNVVALLKQYDWDHQRRVSFEYICWAGVNDTPKHAKELLRLLRGLNCRIQPDSIPSGAEELRNQKGNLPLIRTPLPPFLQRIRHRHIFPKRRQTDGMVPRLPYSKRYHHHHPPFSWRRHPCRLRNACQCPAKILTHLSLQVESILLRKTVKP